MGGLIKTAYVNFIHYAFQQGPKRDCAECGPQARPRDEYISSVGRLGGLKILLGMGRIGERQVAGFVF